MSQSTIEKPLLNMKEITEVLIKHYGIHAGKFETALTFDVGFGPFKREGTDIVAPTMFSSFMGLQLREVPEGEGGNNPNIVDASAVNPAP